MYLPTMIIILYLYILYVNTMVAQNDQNKMMVARLQ